MQYIQLVVCGLFLTVKFRCLFTAVAVLGCLRSLLLHRHRSCYLTLHRHHSCCLRLHCHCSCYLRLHRHHSCCLRLHLHCSCCLRLHCHRSRCLTYLDWVRGGPNLPVLIVNADMSIKVTAMTLKFHDSLQKCIVSMDTKNGEKILGKRKVTQYSYAPANTEFRLKK